MTNDVENKVAGLSDSIKVLMLVGTHCTYCGSMLKIVTEMVKQGEIIDLRVINIEQDPTFANELGVRSVPWLRIGPFELSGSRNKEEIQLWLHRAKSADGIRLYLEEILLEGNVSEATKFVNRNLYTLENVIDLALNPEGKINVRLGAGVIVEELAESDAFKVVVPKLIVALSNQDARVRGDACHYLSLTRDTSYLQEIEILLNDDNEEVKEIARDSIEDLTAINI